VHVSRFVHLVRIEINAVGATSQNRWHRSTRLAGLWRAASRRVGRKCTCVPSCIKPPAGDQGCPSDWYPASHGCRPACRHARAGLWCLLRHRAHAEHAGGAAVDRKAAAGHGAGGARSLRVGESGSSPMRSTFG
jgi:hypothetical protein